MNERKLKGVESYGHDKGAEMFVGNFDINP